MLILDDMNQTRKSRPSILSEDGTRLNENYMQEKEAMAEANSNSDSPQVVPFPTMEEPGLGRVKRSQTMKNKSRGYTMTEASLPEDLEEDGKGDIRSKKRRLSDASSKKKAADLLTASTLSPGDPSPSRRSKTNKLLGLDDSS